METRKCSTGQLSIVLVAIIAYGVRAQPEAPSAPRGQPAPLLFRSPPSGFAASQNNLISSPYVFFQTNLDVTPTTLPPTDLRITYTSDPFLATSQFPNRIRFSQSKLAENVFRDPEPEREERLVSATSLLTQSALKLLEPTEIISTGSVTESSSTIETHGFFNRTALLNNSSLLLQNDWKVQERLSAEVLPGGSSESSGSYSVGNITVGALVGIIAGICTIMVLATVLGLICYRRRHPTWNAAETDLRVLATHYGSYWDDKTLPHYQFNDRMTWPGETHEEMIALDNDAFLKSLEDLGRVSSRPPSKNNWNTQEDNTQADQQRQSTKV